MFVKKFIAQLFGAAKVNEFCTKQIKRHKKRRDDSFKLIVDRMTSNNLKMCQFENEKISLFHNREFQPIRFLIFKFAH